MVIYNWQCFWKCTGVPCNCEWLFTIVKIYELNEERDVMYSDGGISFNGGFKPNIIELREKEKKVSELFKESPPYHSYATYVTDDIYVLTSNNKGNIIGYMPYVAGMRFQKIMFNTFDKALLTAICIKYSGETDAAGVYF